MARRKLPKQEVLGDFLDPGKPTKPKLPANVVVKDGRWYVRIRYKGEDGQRHAAWRECAKNATDAGEVRKALQKELDEHGHESLRNARKTFDDLANFFDEKYLVPAMFVGGRKASGRRSVAPAKSALKALRAYFGSTPLRSITHSTLDSYKRTRLQTPVVFVKTIKTKEGPQKVETRRERSIATVDRELELLRRMITVAMDEHWIHRSPFRRSDVIISSAQENQRQHIISEAEEDLLLAYCAGDRAHLRSYLICALDTGMRFGEMKKMRVCDVNLEARVIVIEATHTKTLRSRTVGITSRLADELRKLCKEKKPGARVFEVESVKTAWTTLRRLTGLKHIRWHDLRHTNATRIERSKKVSHGQLSRHLGHTNLKTTSRYINQDVRSSREIVAALEADATDVAERLDEQLEAKEQSQSVN